MCHNFVLYVEILHLKIVCILLSIQICRLLKQTFIKALTM